ncbi:ABC transporter substrate-binding protein [Cereibacter changlensis]|uniref:ABC transporter substrate-binding protein n=1 Tax=Cereibacter changlensis TaxID=402884 RepID=UPI003593039B
MRGCVRGSDPLGAGLRTVALCASVAGSALLPARAQADAPARVVSINLCTDQLAMMLAAPGQLVSVSALAVEPQSSSMVEEARGIPQNYGQAEQVFLLRPDLVLAGAFTARATVDLLRRLGVTVVELPPADSLDDVAAHLRLVGAAMGREAEAERLVARYEADLARLRVSAEPAPAAMYYPNGYTTGAGTLADEILRHTGFSNVAVAAGLAGGGILPLERLVMAEPEMVVTSLPYPGASRSEEILVHPALQAVRERAGSAEVTDADWICGTPHVLRAVAGMGEARRGLDAMQLSQAAP